MTDDTRAAGSRVAQVSVGIAVLVLLLIAARIVLDGHAEPGPEPDRGAGQRWDGAPAECGDYELALVSPDAGNAGHAAQRCLVDAFEQGRPARLQVTSYTVEGDPILDTYEVVGDGRLRWVHDASQDRFGGQPLVESSVCGHVAVGQRLPEVGHCEA